MEGQVPCLCHWEYQFILLLEQPWKNPFKYQLTLPPFSFLFLLPSLLLHASLLTPPISPSNIERTTSIPQNAFWAPASPRRWWRPCGLRGQAHVLSCAAWGFYAIGTCRLARSQCGKRIHALLWLWVRTNLSSSLKMKSPTNQASQNEPECFKEAGRMLCSDIV